MFRTLPSTVIVCLISLCCLPLYAQSEATEAAQQSAESWLALVDEGSYGESWDEAAAFFKAQVPKQKWEGMLNQVRAPLGKTQSRKLKDAKYTAALPNAPKGEYVVIRYDTSFVNAAATVETVTPMKQEDGSWRVSGYHILPAQ
ncbi:MAG: DUF4019 domain-containing protein [Bryobacterales bacterium]